MGDRVRVTVDRPSGPVTADVLVTGYEQPVVTIDAVPSASEKSKRLLSAWRASR